MCNHSVDQNYTSDMHFLAKSCNTATLRQDKTGEVLQYGTKEERVLRLTHHTYSVDLIIEPTRSKTPKKESVRKALVRKVLYKSK